jgi:hypothetical protein
VAAYEEVAQLSDHERNVVFHVLAQEAMMRLISRVLFACFVFLALPGAIQAQDQGIPDTLRLVAATSGTWTIAAEADSVYVVEMWGWTDKALGGAAMPLKLDLDVAQVTAHKLMDTVIVVDTFIFHTSMPAATTKTFQKFEITDPTNPANGTLLGLIGQIFPPGPIWPINTQQKIGDLVLKVRRAPELPHQMIVVVDSNFFWPGGTFKYSPQTSGLLGFAPQYVGATITINNLISGTEDFAENLAVPISFQLNQNFPNPFNPSTTIKFYNAVKGPVRIDVFNIMGQRVRTLADKDMDIGWQEIVWSGDDANGENVASGIYFYKMSAGAFVEIKKMLLMK